MSNKTERAAAVSSSEIVGLLAEAAEAEYDEVRHVANKEPDSESLWEEVRVLRIIKRVLQRAQGKQPNEKVS